VKHSTLTCNFNRIEQKTIGDEISNDNCGKYIENG
jgi:hypothetical protein